MPQPIPIAIVETPPPVAAATAEPSKGYTKIYIGQDGTELAEPITEAEARRERTPPPAPAPTVEVAIPSDAEIRKMVDEYGELDRQMQMNAATAARFESLKRAIKRMFDEVPADADGTIEGNLYLLRLSPRERERKVRSMPELIEAIGLETFCEVVSVSLAALEDRIGKSRVERMVSEARTGSRRIKAILKLPMVAGVQ